MAPLALPQGDHARKLHRDVAATTFRMTLRREC